MPKYEILSTHENPFHDKARQKSERETGMFGKKKKTIDKSAMSPTRGIFNLAEKIAEFEQMDSDEQEKLKKH